MTENRSGTRIWDMLTNTNMEYAVSDISIGGLKGSGALQTMYGLNGMVNLKFTKFRSVYVYRYIRFEG